jgi:hypothetical protein
MKPLMDRCQLHKPVDPPQKKTAYHLRGGPEYRLPKKNHFPQFFLKIAHFFLFSMSSSETDSGKTKMNFEKPREVFLRNGMKNKNLSHFLHRCHHLGESKLSFSLNFWIFGFPVTVPILRELLRRSGGEFDETKGVFCPNMPIYNKLLQFFPRCQH